MSEPAPASATPFHRRFLSLNAAIRERFGDQFRPLEPDCKVIQFDEPLTPAQLQTAAGLIENRPDVELYVYGRAIRDLGFLRDFGALKRLHLALYELEDIAGFSHVAGSLEELTFSETKKGFSLHFLAAMPQLKRLFLQHHKKDLPVISGLGNLNRLGLSGITLPDLSLLLPLTALRELSIFLGSTTNLALLPGLAALEELWLMRITKLSDLGMLGDLTGLKKLHLDWMRNVTTLPNLARLVGLTDVILEKMKGLTDLTAVAGIPALRRLHIFDMPQLTAESFQCFRGHPRLEELWVETGRKKGDAAAKGMVPGIARWDPGAR